MRPVSKVEPTQAENPLSVSTPQQRLVAMWVSWNAHRRTTGLCSTWDVPLHIIRSDRRGLVRWMEQAFRTLALLRRSKPRILFVQNPSLALTTLSMLTRRLFGYYLVVDAHNEGVRPFARRGKFIHWLTRRLLNEADATIVTNAALARDVLVAGGRALVLSDRLPNPILTQDPVKKGAPEVVVVSSFMSDEPVQAIIAAAATLPRFRFAFTGDGRRFHHENFDVPPNVRFTGYLADKAFWKLLSQAAVVCDFTLKPDCLVCGAYEALALAKPMVLSDNPAIREIFGPAAVLTDNRAGSIASAVRTAIDQRERLEANARRLRAEYPGPWQIKATAVWDAIRAGAAETARRGVV